MLILSTVALSKFANYPPALIRKEFNVEVERTVRELNGQKCKGWDTARADKKQIFSTRSAGRGSLTLSRCSKHCASMRILLPLRPENKNHCVE